MNKIVLCFLLLMTVSYAHASADEPTEDKDVTWFEKNYVQFIFLDDRQDTVSSAQLKQTVLLVEECGKENPSTDKINKFIQSGGLVNRGVSKHLMVRNRNIAPYQFPLYATIEHTANTHVVNICKLLIEAKADPTLCDTLEYPPARRAVQRFKESQKSAEDEAVCKQLIPLLEPNEYICGTSTPAMNYVLAEAHDIQSASLLAFLNEQKTKPPTQKSHNMLNRIRTRTLSGELIKRPDQIKTPTHTPHNASPTYTSSPAQTRPSIQQPPIPAWTTWLSCNML